MGVIADHTFKKGFLLDEDKLRKISKIISDRKRQIASDPLLTYKVYRVGGFTYTTEDAHVLLNEDNFEWNKITRIIVRLEQDKKDTFELDFSQEEIHGRHPVECCFPITTMLKTSFSVQTWSVRPAAIAGVRGSHFSPDFSSAGNRRVFNGLMKL